MSLLLDTHALLWLCEGDRRLSVRARDAIREGANVSGIATWEIVIKAEQEKLCVDGLAPFLAAPDFPELAFTSAHARDAGHSPATTATRSTVPWSPRPARRAGAGDVRPGDAGVRRGAARRHPLTRPTSSPGPL